MNGHSNSVLDVVIYDATLCLICQTQPEDKSILGTVYLTTLQYGERSREVFVHVSCLKEACCGLCTNPIERSFRLGSDPENNPRVYHPNCTEGLRVLDLVVVE